MEKIIILKEIRESWEKGLYVYLEVVNSDKTVLVMLQKESFYGTHKYQVYVHRYFKIGDNWEISVDYEGNEVICACEIISKRFKKDLKEIV